MRRTITPRRSGRSISATRSAERPMIRRLVRVALASAAATAVLATAGCGGADADEPDDVAAQLSASDAALRQAIDAWRASGDPPSAPPPPEVFTQSSVLQ